MISPTLAGIPIYPNGFPISTKTISIQGESIESIFLRNCIANASEKEVQWLKDYVIYYINAPRFDLKALKAKDLKGMTLNELIGECLEYGVDPF